MGRLENPRRIALTILVKVLRDGAYANLELAQALKESEGARRERAFITQEVYGVLRHLTSLDYYISTFLAKPLKSKEAPLQTILRLGFFEILHTEIPPRATVHQWVEAAKEAGPPFWGKLVNGVLRNLLRRKEELTPPPCDGPAAEAAFRHSLPLWLLNMWSRELGESEMLALAAAMDQIPRLNLRVNTLKTDRAALLVRLAEAGAEAEPGALSVDCVKVAGGLALERLNLFQAGLCTVQEEASQMAAIVLDPRPGEKVLDLCAAPGGKTGHIGQRMENRGEILAVDLHRHKLELIAGNLRRLGVTIGEIRGLDGLSLPAAYDGVFDRVLVDAPCSGLGVLHRRIDARYRLKEEDILSLVPLQRGLLKRGAAALRPGGVLVYSTCTVSKRENQQNFAWLLEEERDLEPVEIGSFFPQLPAEDFPAPWMVQLLPSRHDCDGFFIACCRKKGGLGDG